VIRRNVVLGIGLGLAIATAFTLWVSFLRLTAGTEPFERTGTSYSVTILVYYVGFAVGGLMVGLLAPLRKWPLGSALLGFLLMLPMYSAFVIVKAPRSEWLTPFWILSTLGVSVVGGGALGLWIWREEHGRRRNGAE
jgi:MFS family permease